MGKHGVQIARGKDDFNFHEKIGRSKLLMDKNDIKLKKKKMTIFKKFSIKILLKKVNYNYKLKKINLIKIQFHFFLLKNIFIFIILLYGYFCYYMFSPDE